ncbi:MAG: hypothetical protein IIC82_05555 [Chloroflexi bacterium]|nr:hypothetical protein [Chloroflexota bacterium]
MSYEVGAVLVAAPMAAVAAALALYATLVFFSRQVRLNVLYYLGALIPQARGDMVRYVAGGVAFLAIAFLFGFAYAGLIQAFDVNDNIFTWGVLFGLGHWVIDGGALGWMARVHPGIARGEIANPGAFAQHLPFASLVAFLGLHLLYGMFFSAFYDAIR